MRPDVPSLRAFRRRGTGSKNGGRATALKRNSNRSVVAALDGPDRLGEPLDNLGKDAAVDRHHLACRLCSQWRQSLRASEFSRQDREGWPLRSRERCWR